jgi:hypothetical protein
VAPTEQETVLMTRSPGVNEMVPAPAGPDVARTITLIAGMVILNPAQDLPVISFPLIANATQPE